MTQSVAVVTGASRGLGRGIARALGRCGFTVYLTGRNASELEAAAAEVNAAGGCGVSVVCDHRDDAAVTAMFERVRQEGGRLDVLVNNATAVYPAELSAPGPFWEKPLHLVDMIDVGLRSSYVAAYAAAPLMIATGGGLMVHISFYGAVSYFHGPAYGAAKAGTDKMAFDMAEDLRPHNVASVSLWPGFILSDLIKAVPPEQLPPELVARLPTFETPEFSGMVIERLWQDPQRMQWSGETLIGAEMGQRFGLKDLDGKAPLSYRTSMGAPEQRFLCSD
ncbi:SDR family NAD(P)-dependent oxidoreductase [Aestuariicella hydrocarbonica]|uniref:SDR family NAD(P)-dependent oxidoreductase n=1 Tax=Pseudomaricurvus hydrocarbonicus TaxID=1470433 RepID=A0A9E5JV38_9GAMM|nr:SDR family NAD(P)-dependent oxidoreductase [Aestuariicella hydrocarbonica]NHO66001.1 SDR family NAD(P)-dependent oxidoreductase [Aestuariicella hydrocarbonica]